MQISDVGKAAAFPLSSVELATALVYGEVEPEGTPRPRHDRSVRSVLESVVLSALKTGPVFVSFSGGRDSSAVLAIAAHVARQSGHELPIPITLRIDGSAAADETSWQELVFSALRITERQVITIRDELDLVGPVASSTMRRHGLLWPPNGYMHDVMLQRCAGGTLLTGGGGDEIFDDSEASHTQKVLSLRAWPRPRDIARLASSTLTPRWYDRRRARFIPKLPWLSVTGQAAFSRSHVGDLPPPYRSWARSVGDFVRARSMAALRVGQELLATDHDARIVHPFLDPTVLQALAIAGGSRGLGGRTAAMRSIVGDLLPATILSRKDKATFGDALWTRRSLAVARLDSTLDVIQSDPNLAPLIDLDGLRSAWRSDTPHHMTTSLLQAAYIARGMHLEECDL